VSNQREKFEQWAESLDIDLCFYCDDDGEFVEYFMVSTQTAYDSWLACCELHAFGDD